jgi:hypothetical protein
VSVELQALRHSDNPEERSFAEFVTAVAELRTELVAIEKRLSNPENLIPPQYIQKCIEASGRRTSRDVEMLIMDATMRLESILHASEREKMPKEVAIEVMRLREMLTMLQHEFRAERRMSVTA